MQLPWTRWGPQIRSCLFHQPAAHEKGRTNWWHIQCFHWWIGLLCWSLHQSQIRHPFSTSASLYPNLSCKTNNSPLPSLEGRDWGWCGQRCKGSRRRELRWSQLTERHLQLLLSWWIRSFLRSSPGYSRSKPRCEWCCTRDWSKGRLISARIWHRLQGKGCWCSGTSRTRRKALSLDLPRTPYKLPH